MSSNLLLLNLHHNLFSLRITKAQLIRSELQWEDIFLPIEIVSYDRESMTTEMYSDLVSSSRKELEEKSLTIRWPARCCGFLNSFNLRDTELCYTMGNFGLYRFTDHERKLICDLMKKLLSLRSNFTGSTVPFLERNKVFFCKARSFWFRLKKSFEMLKSTFTFDDNHQSISLFI